MARSVWKGPFVDGYLLQKAETAKASSRNEIIKIWSRRSTILPQFVGLTFGVYNGHKFLPVQVNENMVGHKFGEFSPTRTFTGHAADKTRASGRNEIIKIWSRRSTILPQFVGLTFGVYNGQKYLPVLVTENMIGHKFGEFAPTRTYYGHAADKKAKRK